MIFETHAHYDDVQFDSDRDEIIKEVKDRGVERIVDIGAKAESFERIEGLTLRYDFIYGTAGLHPLYLKPDINQYLKLIKEYALKDKFVAIGEIGLDYHDDRRLAGCFGLSEVTDSKVLHKRQQEWFEVQLSLARELKLPVVIHSREAAKDTLDIVKAVGARDIVGVIHCFSYSKEVARDFLNMGFFLGIGGVVTYGNSRKVKETVEYMPFDRLVVETDSPYLAPEPLRHKRNDSGNLRTIIKTIADIKGVYPEEIEDITWENGMRLYGF